MLYDALYELFYSMKANQSNNRYVHTILQSWALSVFFKFFNNKKLIFAFFIKLI